MKAVIGSNVYKIDDGSTYNENYNETLDSAVIRISHLPTEINPDLEPFDDVILQENDGTRIRVMCVDKVVINQEAIGQTDTTFSYTINLFSLTKKMEGIILPNLSNTPHRTGTKITILQYAAKILALYGPKDRQGNAIWGFTDKFIAKFEDVDCPEMQWSNPTFREVLTDLAMIKDCIPILINDDDDEYIDLLDLTETNNANSKPYNFIQKSRSSDDYISEIRMDLQNVMQTNVKGINTTVTTAEYLTLTSDDAIINSENCYLKTQFPILNIKHLWIICFGLAADGTSTTIIRQDLCDFRVTWGNNEDPSNASYQLVYEKKEYDSKTPLYRNKIPAVGTVASVFSEGGEFYSSHNNFCLYFTRNSNRIEGLSDISKTLFAGSVSTLEYLKLLCACNNKDNLYMGLQNAVDINEGNNAYFSTFFQVEYETTYNSVFQASKGDRPNNRRIIADNQTNAWVDAYSQGFLEYQKANRLGNLQKMYNQRVLNKANLYKIGDQISDDIVYRTEYQYYPDHVECNAYATKNYVLRDYFTGIKSKIRTWVNAREEAFIRHDLKKYYCELSFAQDNDSVEYVNNGTELARYLLSPLYESNETPIKYVLVRADEYPSNNSKFALNCVTRLIGNSIVLTAGFDDNWIVDKHPNTGTRTGLETYNNTAIIMADDIAPLQTVGGQYYTPPHFNAGMGNVGGIATNYYKYCDDNGEFDGISMFFLTNLQVSDSYLITNDAVKQLFIDYYNMPVIPDRISNPYKFGFSMEYYKDNKEKPVISTQFEFCVADKSIYFTKLFLERQDMIRNIAKSNLTAYASDTFSKEIPNDAVTTPFSSDSLTITNINDYCVSITANAGGTKKYLYICDANGNLIIVFDKTKTLYLNIRRYM